MRPVIGIMATQTDRDEVFVQIHRHEPFDYFGALSMPMAEYVALRNTLVTGSGASGGAGAEIQLEENGFDGWVKPKKG